MPAQLSSRQTFTDDDGDGPFSPSGHHSIQPTLSAPNSLAPASTCFPHALFRDDMQSPGPSSRSTSPLPYFYSSGHFSAHSDSDSDGGSPVPQRRRKAWPRDEPPRWWLFGEPSPRRRRRDSNAALRTVRRAVRWIVRLPYFPRHPCTILLTLIIFTAFAIALTLTIMYILNPDKEALPWRAYCAVPVTTWDPPPLDAPVTTPDIFTVGASPPYLPFPPDNFDSLVPAGVFLGVFSMDSAMDRRMLIRNTFASHPKSREGAGSGDGGHGTARTIVRFILGQPRGTWERRIMLEMEQFKDIVILPTSENMNSGKSNEFFTWAASNAWVPPIYNSSGAPPEYSYSSETSPPPLPAAHDPVPAPGVHRNWVRPDFVVKADDDSFVMLAELEARLRVALRTPHPAQLSHTVDAQRSLRARDDLAHSDSRNQSVSIEESVAASDPLIYWGYLVKQRFMAGELYALSWALVGYAATDEVVKAHVRGAEDKTTASWMRAHPRADEIRWVNERCWMYDHPKAGTVYSHGFLFPSEAARVRKTIKSYKELSASETAEATNVRAAAATAGVGLPVPRQWAHSTVSTFGTRYTEPVPGLSTLQSIEALVEGSEMSQLHEGSLTTPEMAWRQREGRAARYEGKRLGGTVVVHFIKKRMWYQETALALLGGDEETELELNRRWRQDVSQNRTL